MIAVIFEFLANAGENANLPRHGNGATIAS